MRIVENSVFGFFLVIFLLGLCIAEARNSDENEDAFAAVLPYFSEKVRNVSVKVGENAELRCTVDNLNNYKVAWVRVDTQTILTIHNHVITRNPRTSLSRPATNKWNLHVKRVQQSDRGWYMCQINTDPMIHRSGFLEVVVPPVIENDDDETDLVVRENESVNLTCKVRGHPKPHVVWRRSDAKDILVDNHKVALVENAVLSMPRVSRLHMGDYLCVASNGIAPSAKRLFRIRVQFPPMFWIPSQREGVVIGQSRVVLECHSEAFPKSINYWVRGLDESMVVSDERHETLIVENGYKVYMKLVVSNVSRNDLMEYRCVAKNSLGSSDGSIVVYETSMTTTTTAITTALTTAENGGRSNPKKRRRGKDRRKMRKTRVNSNKVDYQDENYDQDISEGNNQWKRIYVALDDSSERRRQETSQHWSLLTTTKSTPTSASNSNLELNIITTLIIIFITLVSIV